MNLNTMKRSLVFAALGFSLATAVHAAPDPLAAGGTNTVAGGMLDEQLSFFGATFASGGLGNSGATLQWQVSPFSGTNGSKTIAGTLWSTVLTGDSNNPFGLGGFDWVYQVVLSSANNTEVETLTTNAWDNLPGVILGGTTTWDGYVRIPTVGGFPGGGLPGCPAELTGCAPAPALASPGPRPPLSVSKNGVGDNITFTWGTVPGVNALDGTRRSPFLVVYTGPSIIGYANQGIQDGASAEAKGFAPSPIPEPETYAMMLAGLGLMGFVARRRKRTS